MHLVGRDDLGLGTSFDSAYDVLSHVPRVHAELDGSFVWSEADWQVDGMLYDRDEQLRYVELKGHCPRHIWRQLISLLCATPELAVVVKLGESGLYDLQEFESCTWGEQSDPR